ncbi:MAG: hypothetical protein K2K81_06280, partial [Muribaculaceae bacterium]|nr:hypothetical protein [Muribaculaceae bacterium]
ALEVTFEWDTPGSVRIQLESAYGPFVDLAPDQTSYVLTEAGSCYVYGADGYMVTGATPSDGSDPLKPIKTSFGICVGKFFGSSSDGLTYKVNVEKIERNDTFTADVVNGVEYVTAKFSSGYALDLQEGSHAYKFNPSIDGTMTISLSDVASAYKVTLNGTEIEKNFFYPRYEDINIKPGDLLFIQVFEGEEPDDVSFTIEYGEGMEGCLLNVYNRTTGQFIAPADFTDNSITVKPGTELKVNLREEDFVFTKLLLNDVDVTSDIRNSSIEVLLTQENTTLRIEGEAKQFANIDFIGYIINADALNLSLTYAGTTFDIPEGEKVESDITVTDTLIMPAEETKKYVIPISEKNGKFFFRPKKGYYISAVYTRSPEGAVELHPGNSSISADIDGTIFYMVVEKLPEKYNARLKVTGHDFFMKVSANSTLSDIWGNPANPAYSSAEGEREISFIPGYGTPIVFGFVGDETKEPAVYLDGAQVSGIIDEESGAIEFFVTPYTPENGDAREAGIQSTIEVYNSFNDRPQMSGASLQLEGGATAEFYYSPVMHEANPEGETVISGTQFTVKPTSPKPVVTYKGETVALDEDGCFTFTATGNARNNVVKVMQADESGVNSLTGDSNSNVTVYSIDGRRVLINAPASRLNELEKGVYIINGKKAVVK